MLPEGVKERKAKIIYVNRNPRDAVVSYYNHFRVLEGFSGKWKDIPYYVLDIESQMTTFEIHGS